METKLISVRVNEDVLAHLDTMCKTGSYYNRSYWINEMLQFCVSLDEQGLGKLFREFYRYRGDEISINDYDITKGDWSKFKSK